jgi:cyclopropane-fatty-acyl-phospholipid synthase
MNMLVGLMEKGMLPDSVIRRGIRQLLRKRLQEEDHGPMINRERQRKLFAELAAGPLADATDLANQQHHELPLNFSQKFWDLAVNTVAVSTPQV